MAAAAVTVVVPTRDRFPLLTATLRSVLDQPGVDVRVVVVDDGSTDRTTALLRATPDPRVEVVRHEQSQGVSAARNTGLAQVTTPWVAFCDDDDLWSTTKLASQLAALDADPACGWACSGSVSFWAADGRVLRHKRAPLARDAARGLLGHNTVPGGGSGVLAATELVRAVGGFDPSLSNLADWECWLRLAQEAPLALVTAADVGYRIHPSSMAHAVARSEQELAQVRRKHDGLYRAAGADVDQVIWESYFARMLHAAGDWPSGAVRNLRVLRDHGRGRAVLQPVKHAVRPWARRWDEQQLRRRAPEVHAYATTWLSRQLATPAAPTQRTGSATGADVTAC